MDEFDEYTKALIIMGMITVSVLVWFLVASLAGEVFDHKKTAPSDEPEVETPPTPEPAASPATVTARPALDRTPADPRLLAAVSARNWAAANQLLRSGVSPRGVDTQGHSLLFLAHKRQDEQMVQLLKSHGAKQTG
ncbi:MAG: ankyrin repeat domain-containing protein [Burkholderiaceae bacterium]|nr:ankyrin repeat domain-containing protein [Burkholderiaceae bacterium]